MRQHRTNLLLIYSRPIETQVPRAPTPQTVPASTLHELLHGELLTILIKWLVKKITR